VFLTLVGESRGHEGETPHPAGSALAGQTVAAAVAGARMAVPQLLERRLDPGFERGARQTVVGRLEIPDQEPAGVTPRHDAHRASSGLAGLAASHAARVLSI